MSRRDEIDVGALMECCLGQQDIIKRQSRIIERLSQAGFIDAETEEEIRKVEDVKREKEWEI